MNYQHNTTLRNIWNDLSPLLRRYRGSIIIGIFLSLTGSLFSYVAPLGIQHFMDELFAHKPLSDSLEWGGLMLSALALEMASIRGKVYFLTRSIFGFTAELRSQLQEHLLYCPISFFDRSRTGELVSRVMKDAEGLSRTIGADLGSTVTAVFEVAIGIAYLLWCSASMAAVALGFFVSAIAFAIVGLRKAKPALREQPRLLAKLSAHVTDLIAGIRTIRIYHAHEQEAYRVREMCTDVADTAIRIKRTTARISANSLCILGIGLITLVYVGARRTEAHLMSLGAFTAFTFVFWRLMWPVLNLVNVGERVLEGAVSIERVVELLLHPREETERAATVSLSGIKGTIEFDHVSFSYGSGLFSLKDISFELQPGTTTALVGPSGVGKSTIMALLAGFYKPGQGAIRIDGVDLSTIHLDSYRKQVALVQQRCFLFPGSVRDNVRLSRPSAMESELDEALQAVGISSWAEESAAEGCSRVGEQGTKLSGGQQQRVSIARAFLANPQVLLLDEATSSLDLESEAGIQRSLRQLMRNRTTLIIAHRLSTIRNADQILVLDNGEIIERGSHEELMQFGVRYPKLYDDAMGWDTEEGVPRAGSHFSAAGGSLG